MDLKSYLNLYALLQTDKSTKEERRAFGLTVKEDRNRPIRQLLSWIKVHQERLKRPTLGERVASYLYAVTLLFVAIGCMIGVLSGIVLLSYHGDEPVNVVYFMAMVIALPLITILLTLLSIFKVQSSQSVLVHISPSYWMEKIVAFFPSQTHNPIDRLKINPLLANWIVIKRAQLIALFFSIGLLLALLVEVSTKDIAFAWSTTLQVTPEAFHNFLNTVALPWREWLPAAVPSLELVEQSHYFRLGERLSDEMISNAAKLGEWWKFLALATLFYAIILRFLIYVVASLGLNLALKKSLLALEGANTLLRDMNEPMISTHATQPHESSIFTNQSEIQKLFHVDASYDVVQGWAMPLGQIQVMSESMQIISPNLFEVGGSNTLEEDSDIVSKSHGEVLLYVKAWEPPTMDLMDYLESLLKKADKVVIYPVGPASEGYSSASKFINIWANKLSLLNDDKIYLLDLGSGVPDA